MSMADKAHRSANKGCTSRDRTISRAMSNFNLEPGFSRSELDSAYRKLCLKTSPDKGGCTKDFEIVAKCYKVLTPIARSRRDARDVDEVVVKREELSHDTQPTRVSRSFESANRDYLQARGQHLSRGYGDWLGQAIPSERQAPSRVRFQDLHTTFDRMNCQTNGAVSTFVVKEIDLESSIAHCIHDNPATFDGSWYADLQSAYG